jgi:hypothetical protein
MDFQKRAEFAGAIEIRSAKVPEGMICVGFYLTITFKIDV